MGCTTAALAGVPPTPAKLAVFAKDGSCSWQPCTVVDFNEETNSYSVVTKPAAAAAEGEGEGPGEPAAAAVLSVPRVRLHFSAEDPFMFAKRFAEAHASRARAESLLRYSLYVDSMPVEDLLPLTSEQINRMVEFALNSKKLKDKLMDTSPLISEVNMEYARTMNKVKVWAVRGSQGRG